MERRTGPSFSRSKSTSSPSVARSGAVSYRLAGGCGHQAHQGRGWKKPGTPRHAPHRAMASSHQPRTGSSTVPLALTGRARLTCSQKARRRSSRRAGGLPAISAALMAPIEMPATQPTSCARVASAS